MEERKIEPIYNRLALVDALIQLECRVKNAGNSGKWQLEGWDTFSSEDYPLKGLYDTEAQAQKAAEKRLADLEETQPTVTSGGPNGIQDQVYVVGPDGSGYRYRNDLQRSEMPVQKAIDVATRLHEGQKRKGNGWPYIVHPLTVALNVAQYTNNEDIIISALLHDVLEDVPGYSDEDMRRDFGNRITAIVQEVSEDKDPNASKEEEVATWTSRKQGYIRHLLVASNEAMLICASDKIHNLQSLAEAYEQDGEAMWQRFNAPANKRFWFYDQVLAILKHRLKCTVVDELQTALEHAKKTCKQN